MKKAKIWDIIVILFGNFLLALSVEYFVLPFDILSGGVAGLAVIITPFVRLDANIIIDILVLAFFVMGWIVLGREFALKTALCSLTYPFFLEFLSRYHVSLEIDKLLSCIYGGIIAGVGIGLVFRKNASTGGTDIPPLIVHKYTGLPVGTLVMATDTIVAAAGFMVYGIEDVLMGIIYIYCSTFAINKMMVPKTNGAVALYILSKEKDAICDYIHDVLSRGTTIIPAKGGYTNSDREVILTVVAKNQYNNLSEFLQKTDPHAFIIVSDAKEIKGEGFTYETRV